MSSTVQRFLPVALTAALVSACADAPTSAVGLSPSAPSAHLIPSATPEVEYIGLCKAGPVGTYTFAATANQPVLRDAATGNYDQTAATYTIVVSAGSTIDVDGTVVPGACYNFTNIADHNHIAVVGGTTTATVTVVESDIPAGVDFHHVVVYQRNGLAVTPNSSTTNSASGQAGGTQAQPGTLGASIVFYNVPEPAGAVLLIIDEDGIDNGLHFNKDGGWIVPSGPHFFKSDGPYGVNENNAFKGQRAVLPFFANNVGKTITVKTGKTDDEAWFAPNCIPEQFILTNDKEDPDCVTDVAARDVLIDNFMAPNPSPPEERLDKIPHLIPLRALGLNALVGRLVCALVYDSDISVNYDHDKPAMGVNGKLQGETYGIVAFTVVSTHLLDGFSSSTLPQVKILIEPVSKCGTWLLFRAPVPKSSSVPNDRTPPGSTYGYKIPIMAPPVFF